MALAVVALGSCSRAQSVPPDLNGPPPPKSTITAVSLSRQGCGLGNCPTYTVTFMRANSATYVGERYVDKIGTYSGVIDFDLIAAWLDSQDVDAYAGQYEMGSADGEVISLKITRNGRTEVIHSEFTRSLPVPIRGMIAAIDGFADRVSWKPASALDPYLGYFLTDNKPGELTILSLYPTGTGTDVQGGSYTFIPARCEADGLANGGEELRLHLVGRRITGMRRQIPSGRSAAGPRMPIIVRANTGTLTISQASSEKTYWRVPYLEFHSTIWAFYKRFGRGGQAIPADCSSSEPH